MEYHGSGLVFEPTMEPTLELNLEPFSNFADFNKVYMAPVY